MPRYANSVMFGFDFQSNAAILLMIENMVDLKTIRIEGEEDIEIGLNNGAYILAQAKSVVNSSIDFSHVRQKAKESMTSLSEAAQKLQVSQLVYITNSPNPFNDESSKHMFSGGGRVRYDNLPQPTKDIILGWLSKIVNPLNTDLLTIRVVSFETDDELQRYKEVLSRVSDFIGNLNISYDGLRKKLLDVWQNMFDKNGSKSNRNIKLTKKEIIWPIIVFITGRGLLNRDAPYCDNMDDGLYEDINRRYGEIIEETCERFDIIVKVITDFNDEKISGRDAIVHFVDQHWANYIEDFGLAALDPSIRENLSKVILYTMLKKRFDINQIKQSVKL